MSDVFMLTSKKRWPAIRYTVVIALALTLLVLLRRDVARTNAGDVGSLGTAIRSITNDPQSLEPLMTKLPWLKSARVPLHERLQQIAHGGLGRRGIVIAASDSHFDLVRALTRSIRETFNSDLPIEIFHEDMSAAHIAVLESHASIACVEMPRELAVHGVQGTFAMKPFAALLSSFSDIVLMDADTLLFTDPSNFFRHSCSMRLFRDRSVLTEPSGSKNREMRRYLAELFGGDSTKRDEGFTSYGLGRITDGISDHEIESGVVVICQSCSSSGAGTRTAPRLNLLTLVFVCALNTIHFRTSTTMASRKGFWDVFHGDKESWWIARRFLVDDGDDPSLCVGRNAAGVIGRPVFVDGQRYICGGPLLHADDDLSPLWANGALFANKARSLTRLVDPVDWVVDVDLTRTPHWEVGGQGVYSSCLAVGPGTSGLATGTVKGEMADLVRKYLILFKAET